MHPPRHATASGRPTPGPTSSVAWVERSNQYAQILLDAQAPFGPEDMSFMGIPGYDLLITDLQPGFPHASAPPVRGPATS